MKRKIKRYNKNLAGYISRKWDNFYLARFGYYEADVEVVKEYSGGKGFFLFILFPPLALLGKRSYWKVTFEKNNV